MPSRLHRLGRGVIFTHLVLAPLVFSRVTTESFELPKYLLLLATATFMGGLGLAGFWPSRSSSSPGRPGGWRRLLEDPVGAAALLFAFSALLSTVTSISPLTSWAGAHESFAGLTTVAGYAVLFFASSESNYVTGQVMSVSGGLTFAG